MKKIISSILLLLLTIVSFKSYSQQKLDLDSLIKRFNKSSKSTESISFETYYLSFGKSGAYNCTKLLYKKKIIKYQSLPTAIAVKTIFSDKQYYLTVNNSVDTNIVANLQKFSKTNSGKKIKCNAIIYKGCEVKGVPFIIIDKVDFIN